ncbi:hypothetical protein J8F10_15655 [Gemmata sp. G18]|uniref:Uncharacterized protein n=1 Tax=Gemmata palustris TaxID=2822762 RepID=A0ABS5BSK5_9BACT|nr:hypothetical protein [Gemmata palustris]MBP3956710.1 hypothetical protein [Gemmata palustris]
MADVIPFAGEPNAAPADPTPLLALARAPLSRRRYFQEFSPEHQEAEVQQHARGLAIAASDIGKSAARISTALRLLTTEVRRFLEQWPDDAAAEAARLAAIVAAGLNPNSERSLTGCGPEHIQHTVEELRIWQPVLNIVRERLEACEHLDVVGSEQQRDTSDRRAA